MQYRKSFAIQDGLAETGLAERVRSALLRHGFRIVSGDGIPIRAERGSGAAKWYSFDIRKYKTALVVSVTPQSLTFSYNIQIGAAVPTPGDAMQLEKELGEIMGIVSGHLVSREGGKAEVGAFAGYTKGGAWALLGIALLSYFVYPPAGLFAVVLGIVSLSASTRYRLGANIIFLNIIAVALGAAAYFLSLLPL